MKKLTSKQRVINAFERIPMDRVPINYLCNAGIDLRLKKHFNLAAKDNDGLLNALNVDFRGIGASYTGPKLYDDMPGVRVDNWGIHYKWIEHQNGGYWDYCDFPLQKATLEEIENWKFPDPGLFDYSNVRVACGRYKDYAKCLTCYGDIINGNGMLRGMEQTLVDLALDEPEGLLLAKRRVNVQMQIAERILDAAAGGIDIFWLGEDLGTQHGQMISLEVFRRNIRPHYERMIELAKAFNCKVMIHTCGSSSWVYEDFIEMGIDAVDTLQPECKNMSPRYLVDNFGGRLSFHGCISTAGNVAHGTSEEVRKEVCEVLEIMKPTNSYMLSPTHQLQDNSPTENVLALYAAAMEYG